MRFDDSLTTVLASDTATSAGALAAWRQLVDLVGRGRIAEDEAVFARLRSLREVIPAEARAASARALAFARPSAAMVAFFAEDRLAISAPVLRTATLANDVWAALLPRLTPESRSILRHRRDLPDDVVRGLDSFGATDFVLPFEGEPEAAVEEAPPPPPMPQPPADTPLSDTPFVALGEVARALPMVEQARLATVAVEDDRFEIAELVSRIDAFQRRRETAAAPASPPVRAAGFRFTTNAAGVIQHVDGVAPGALIGASLAYAVPQGVVSIDAVMSGALRRRSRFVDARLDIGGHSDAAGAWRVSGAPIFDDRTGRFLGVAGHARRPRLDEGAVPGERQAASDALRQLVHELRTPTNAITGFAELIEAQLLGPVAPSYRAHAAAIRNQAGKLLAAIEDLDTAARLESDALDVRSGEVALVPLLDRVAADLAPLAAMRGTRLIIDNVGDLVAAADDRLIERLLSRLLASLLALGAPGEVIALSAAIAASGQIALTIGRPAALTIDDRGNVISTPEHDDEPLLGTDFTLRLVRNLAAELGGSLELEASYLTLRIPTVTGARVEQAIS